MSSVKVTRTAAMHDRYVNVIRDANARVMTVKGHKMWCVIWCDRGWRISTHASLVADCHSEVRKRDWVGMTDVVMVVVMMMTMCVLVV
jgi:hypothetical protein